MISIDKKFRFSIITILLITSGFYLFAYNGSNAQLTLSQDPEKVIVWAYNNPFGEENSPTDALTDFGESYMVPIYNGLMRRTVASDYAYVPDLAAAMPVITPNMTVWTFTLKPGLKFSDGSNLNASSVVFSYRVHLTASIESTSTILAKYLTNDSITEIDNLTVRFNITKAYAFAPTLFSQWIYSENHFGPQYDACLVDVTLAACNWNTDLTGGNLVGGSGPFMVNTYDPTNNIIELFPNPFYYMSDQIKIDRIIFRTIVDTTAAQVNFAAGEINIFDSHYKAKSSDLSIVPDITEEFVGAPSVQEMVPNHNHQYFGLGEYTTTGSNARTDFSLGANQTVARNIRKAMSHMIDRVFIENEITGGLSIPAATIMPTVSIGWDNTILPHAYDVNLAKTFMEAAGFDYTGKTYDIVTGAMNSPFFTISLLSPTDNVDREQWSEIMVQELPKIGIGIKEHLTVTLSNLLPRTYGNPLPPPDYDNGGYDIFFSGLNFGLDWDPFRLYELEFQNPSCCNVYNYNNATTATKIEDYINELDVVIRNILVKRVQEILYDDLPTLPIIHEVDHWAWANNIAGLNGLSMSQRIIEWELVDIVKVITITETLSSINPKTETEYITTTDQSTETSFLETTKLITTTEINSITTTESLTDTASLPFSVLGLFFGMIFTVTITLFTTRKAKKFDE